MIQTDPDAYSTHQVPLIAAVLQTKGPVIEFGMGHYTTPLLHQLCCNNRMLFSIEASREYAEQFEYLRTPRHAIIYVENHDWTQADRILDKISDRWGVVFVDHGDMEARAPAILKFKDRAELIVVHDSNVRTEEGKSAYDYDEAFALFTHRYEYTPYIIHTMVLSNIRPFQLLQLHGKDIVR